jgi:threonine/homoserine/homoserine lactone efflux protein
MNWSAYGTYLAFALVLVLIPGPDFAVVTKNSLVGGRRRGWWSALGVASSNTLQGLAAATGLGAVIARSEPVFETVKWAGIAYLAYLAVQSFRSARRGRYDRDAAPASDSGTRLRGWRQGFLSNITNPKVLVFYLAVLPQFLGRHAAIPVLMVFVVSHALLSLCYLSLLVTVLTRVRVVFQRRAVRRAMDAATGCALVGFGAKLAVDNI